MWLQDLLKRKLYLCKCIFIEKKRISIHIKGILFFQLFSNPLRIHRVWRPWNKRLYLVSFLLAWAPAMRSTQLLENIPTRKYCISMIMVHCISGHPLNVFPEILFQQYDNVFQLHYSTVTVTTNSCTYGTISPGREFRPLIVIFLSQNRPEFGSKLLVSTKAKLSFSISLFLPSCFVLLLFSDHNSWAFVETIT